MLSDLFESRARKDALLLVARAGRRLSRKFKEHPRMAGIARGEIRRIRDSARNCPEDRLPMIASMLDALDQRLAE